MVHFTARAALPRKRGPCFYGIWPYGRAFIAIRDNEIAADAMGINTTKYKIMSFCI